MYNYSLLNNAIRLLLISHSTITQQQDKHNIHNIHCHPFAVYDVGLSCRFVIFERWVHTKDAHALLSREGRVK